MTPEPEGTALNQQLALYLYLQCSRVTLCWCVRDPGMLTATDRVCGSSSSVEYSTTRTYSPADGRRLCISTLICSRSGNQIKSNPNWQVTEPCWLFPTFPISYIVAAAHSHVGVPRGDLLGRAGAWQVVVMATAGIAARDGGVGVQREIPVQQTAGETQNLLLISELISRPDEWPQLII